MMKLTCTATKCVNNNSGLCNAQKIKVIGEYTYYGGTTHCYTFTENTVKNSISNSMDGSLSSSIGTSFGSGNNSIAPNVLCTAEECYYNASGMCNANKIMVSGGGTHSIDGTSCATFVKGHK